MSSISLVNSQISPVETILSSIKECRSDTLPDFLSKELPKKLGTLSLDELQASVNVNKGKPFDIVSHAERVLRMPKSEVGEGSLVRKLDPSWILHFFTNLIDTIISAFNFYDESNLPTSIYEKHVRIQIYYRLFWEIPFDLILLIQPLVLVAWQAYLIAMAVLLAAAAAIYVYKKWINPFPAVIQGGADITHLIAKEPLLPISPQRDKTKGMISSLESKASLFLSGPSGWGKTYSVAKLHQMISAGEVPSLKNKKIVYIKGGAFASESQKFCVVDNFKALESQLSSHRDRVIVFIDEVQNFVQGGHLGLLQDFIRDFQCIVATTQEDYEQITKLNTSNSFKRSVELIEFEKWDEAEIKRFLKAFMDREAQDIVWNESSLTKVIEKTESLREMVSKLRRAITECRKHYKPVIKELTEKLREVEETESDPFHNIFENLQKSEQLKEKISNLEVEQNKVIEEVKFVQILIQERNKLKKDLIDDAASIVKVGGQNLDPALHKRYLFGLHKLLPLMESEIEKKASSDLLTAKKISLRLDDHFISALFPKK